jgi:hypothetical protein
MKKDATTNACIREGIESQSFFRALVVASGLVAEEDFLRKGFFRSQDMERGLSQ